MAKELEDLKHESKYLKNKLEKISFNHSKKNKKNKTINNIINFNKTSFIKVKKLNNISSFKPVNYLNTKSIINGSENNIKNIKSLNIGILFKNKISKKKKFLKLNKIKTIWKNEIPLLTSTFAKSYDKKIVIVIKISILLLTQVSLSINHFPKRIL